MKNYILWVVRILVGLLFIFSGLIKLNDPTGFAIKLEEYFTVFGTEFLNPITVGLSIFICALEIVLGIALLLGIEGVLVSWGLLLMILFFTFLTFYSAYFNKVTDCGCFGDAIKLTPWESFTKDIVLTVLILYIFIFKTSIQSFFSQKLGWAIFGLGFLGSVLVGNYFYNHLPYIDFLPYKIGNKIAEQMTIPEGEQPDQYKVIYTLSNSKTQEVKEIDDREYISSGIWEDSTWAITQTSEPILVKKGYTPKIKNLRIISEDGLEFQEDMLNDENYSFWIVYEDFSNENKALAKALNDVSLLAEEFGFRTIGLTSASSEEVMEYRQTHKVFYEFYYCDATELKSMVRSKPGLLLIKNGVVINKWHYNDIPAIEELQKVFEGSSN
jgi:uncharacterized membrane protein YphA (DoxX/SURF4 family)